MAIDGANVNRAVMPDLNVGVVNQPNNDRIQRVVESIYEGAIRNVMEDFGRKIVWAWNTTIDSLKADAVIVTLIFFSIFVGFGITTAIQSAIVYVIAKFVTVAWQDRGLQACIDLLRREILTLNVRNQGLIDQHEIDRGSLDKITWERGQLRDELDRANQDVVQARQERDAITLQRAPLIIERDRIRMDYERLLNENQETELQRREEKNQHLQLVQERDQAVREKEEAVEAQMNQKEDYQNAIRQASILEARLEQSHSGEELNRILDRFHLLYIENIEKHGGQGSGSTHLELKRLIPLYKTHRERHHQMLDELILKVDRNNEIRVHLEGILEISKEEIGHLERISETFHLNEVLQRHIERNR